MPDDVKTTAVLERAQQLFQEYYASCFWHMKTDLVVTEAMLPMIVKGLCVYGGRKGMCAAAKLQGEKLPISNESTELAFRFFPSRPDKDLEHRLHPADHAVNQALALADRPHVGVFIDILPRQL